MARDGTTAELASVATQTSSARAVRSMHPEVERASSHVTPGATTLTLYYDPLANKVHPLLIG